MRAAEPDSSSGSRRNRCRSADGAMRRTCATATSSACSKLASALAARISVNSARNPSVPSCMHSRAALSITESGIDMRANRSRPATMRRRRTPSALFHFATNSALPRSNSSRRFTISTRSAS